MSSFPACPPSSPSVRQGPCTTGLAALLVRKPRPGVQAPGQSPGEASTLAQHLLVQTPVPTHSHAHTASATTFPARPHVCPTRQPSSPHSVPPPGCGRGSRLPLPRAGPGSEGRSSETALSTCPPAQDTEGATDESSKGQGLAAWDQNSCLRTAEHCVPSQEKGRGHPICQHLRLSEDFPRHQSSDPRILGNAQKTVSAIQCR